MSTSTLGLVGLVLQSWEGTHNGETHVMANIQHAQLANHVDSYYGIRGLHTLSES